MTRQHALLTLAGTIVVLAPSYLLVALALLVAWQVARYGTHRRNHR